MMPDFAITKRRCKVLVRRCVESVQNIKKKNNLDSRRSPYVHKPHPFDSPPQRLVSV